MSLRILHVSPYSESAWAYGGIPRVVGALTRGLARRGHRVTVCATDVCDETTRLAAPHVPGVDVRLFPNVSNRAAYRHQAFFPIGLRGHLRQHAADFDIAHLHACRNLPGAFAARCLQRAGVPYVLAPNGTAPIIERRRTAKRVFDAFVGRSVVNGAARVLAVSAAEVRQLAAMGVPLAAIRQVPNPIDLEEFSTSLGGGVFRREYGLGTAPTVMFLGKITPRKNVDILVHAFARLQNSEARLVVAGNDMGGGRQARVLAHRLGVGSQTIFPGLLTGSDRLHALADADLVVYASEHEVFGLVPFEALLAGTPVVVADDSGCGDLVSRTGGGLIVPAGHVDALSASIQQMLDHRAEWRAKAAGARSLVRASYGSGSVCAELERVYLEMLEGAVRRGAGPPMGAVA